MFREGGSTGGKRQSQRKHTVLNTSATVKRLKKSEEKKVSPSLVFMSRFLESHCPQSIPYHP